MIYFDNAATTYPKPDVVINEITEVMKYSGGNPGRGSHRLSLAAANKIYDARCAVAAHFGGSPENVVFTYNTTYALNIAINQVFRKIKKSSAKADNFSVFLQSSIRKSSYATSIFDLFILSTSVSWSV